MPAKTNLELVQEFSQSVLPTRIRIATPINEPLSGTIDFWDRWASEKATSDLGKAVEGWRRQSVPK